MVGVKELAYRSLKSLSRSHQLRMEASFFRQNLSAESLHCFSFGENLVSIQQAIAEKNTHVLCGQTNPNAIPSPLVRIITIGAKSSVNIPYTSGR